MSFADRIFNQATRGTNTNPGLPNTLAALLVAQAQHETGNFLSNIFTNFNNAFGYAFYPGSLYQIGPGSIADNGQPVARYATVEDSVKELIDWIYRRVKEGKFPANLATITEPEQYAKLLKDAGYYTAPLSVYTNGLKYYFTRVLEIVEKPTAQITMLAVSAFVLWYYMRKKK